MDTLVPDRDTPQYPLTFFAGGGGAAQRSHTTGDDRHPPQRQHSSGRSWQVRRCPGAQTPPRNSAGSGWSVVSQQKRRRFLFVSEEKPDALVLRSESTTTHRCVLVINAYRTRIFLDSLIKEVKLFVQAENFFHQSGPSPQTSRSGQDDGMKPPNARLQRLGHQCSSSARTFLRRRSKSCHVSAAVS